MYYLNNVCFVCLSDKNLKAVIYNETDNELFTQVRYALPELTICNPENPLFICNSCYANLKCFYKFKKRCLGNYNRLNHYINVLQGPNNTQNQGSRELQIKIINGGEIINFKNDIHLNIEESENEMTTWTEQYDNCNQEKNIEDNIDVKFESLGSEDSGDQELYQHLVKCETVMEEDKEDSASISSVKINVSVNNAPNFNTDIPEYKCLMCTQVFSDEIKFNNHTNTHIKSMKDLECTICHKKFALKGSLTRHMRFHLNIKNLECNICNKKFSQLNHLEIHKKYHLGIKEFECATCKKKFTEKGKLNKHMRLHEDVRDFECNICSKKFVESSNLVRHMKFHLGIKDFECTICSKKFIYKCGLKHHLKSHEPLASSAASSTAEANVSDNCEIATLPNPPIL